MASLQRVITVDPTGDVGRIVRSAMDLMGRSVIFMDIPTGTEALEEIGRGGCNLVVTAWELHNDMRGLELALRVKQASEKTAIVVLGDIDDPERLDDETTVNSPFAYLSRPVNVNTLLRVLNAGLEGEDVKEAVSAPSSAGPVPVDMGPVPVIDLNVAQGFIDSLLTDLGAMAIILANRTGEVLLERGAVGYLDRQRLTAALLPSILSHIEVKDVVGGQASSLQFYDGDDHDVFVLTIGVHYFMCIVFDGQGGSRQLGLVRNYGGRAVNDLLAVLGPPAWVFEAPAKKEKERAVAKKKETTELQITEAEPLARGRFGAGEVMEEEEAEPELVAEEAILEAIPSDEFDDLLGALEKEGDVKFSDDLFDPDKLAEIAEQTRGSKTISFDDAIDLGIIDS